MQMEDLQRRADLIRAQQEYYAQQQSQYGGPSRPLYVPPQGDPYAMNGPGYGGGYGYGYGGPSQGRSMGGSALPLMGALAGGLLLGDIIGGGFGGF
jgi:hypothetical protein